MARGKALVAKLRADPKVVDAEALAAWIGRRKRYKKAGLSGKAASNLAGKKGGADVARMAGDLPKAERRKSTKRHRDPMAETRRRKKQMAEDDDPFNEDFGPNKKKSKEDQRREREEAQVLKQMEKEERGKLHTIIRDAGGIKTRDDLREEYRGIPNNFKRKDGMPGDEMAEYLGMYFPELGIESERDLIDYFAA